MRLLTAYIQNCRIFFEFKELLFDQSGGRRVQQKPGVQPNERLRVHKQQRDSNQASCASLVLACVSQRLLKHLRGAQLRQGGLVSRMPRNVQEKRVVYKLKIEQQKIFCKL
jgi:hypothetical protein